MKMGKDSNNSVPDEENRYAGVVLRALEVEVLLKAVETGLYDRIRAISSGLAFLTAPE